MSAHAYCLCPRGSNSIRGVAQGLKADEVLITVQNDGVVLQNTTRQEQVISWALGSQHIDFVTAAVFAPSSNTVHAVVQQSSQGSSSPFLLSWSATAQQGSLEQLAKREALSGSVHSLHPVTLSAPTTAQEPASSSVAVVYYDGGVALGAEEVAGAADRPNGCRVLHASAHGNLLAVVCHVASAAHQHSIKIYDLQTGTRRSQHAIPSDAAANAKLISAAFQSQQLVCLWSSGLLEAFSIPADSPDTAVRLKTSRQLLNFALPAHAITDEQPDQQQASAKAVNAPKSRKKRRQPAADSEAEQPLENSASSASFVPALVPLGGHSVAAIRDPTQTPTSDPNPTPTNGHQPASLEVTVMDTLYGCVHSVVPVRLPKSATAGGAAGAGSQSRTRQQILRLSTGAGGFVMLSHDAVWSMSVPVQKSSLASLVGALNLRNPAGNPAVKAAVQAMGEEECASSSTPPLLEHARPSWTHSLPPSRQASTSGRDHLAIPASVRWQLDASSQQAQLLEQQLTQQLSEGWSDNDACRCYLVDMMRTCQQSHVQLSTNLVASIAAMLAKQQWWGALDALLKAQALPLLSQCPGLVQSIVEGGHFTLLPVILPKAKDIPRSELLRVLQLLLSPATAAMTAHCQHHRKKLRSTAVASVEAAESACLAHIKAEGELSVVDQTLQDKVARAAFEAAAVDGLSAQEVCLHPIVGMTLDSELLTSALRQLSLPQALKLAEYLLRMLSKYTETLSDLGPTSSSNVKVQMRIPKMQQVLEWLCLLFDAHITSFHRQPGCQKVLRQLQDLVHIQMGSLQQISLLRGITEHLSSKAAVPFADQQTASLYTIEMLDFRIA